MPTDTKYQMLEKLSLELLQEANGLAAHIDNLGSPKGEHLALLAATSSEIYLGLKHFNEAQDQGQKRQCYEEIKRNKDKMAAYLETPATVLDIEDYEIVKSTNFAFGAFELELKRRYYDFLKDTGTEKSGHRK